MPTQEPRGPDANAIYIDARTLDSSPDLIQRVGHFMELAQRVEANPLCGSNPPLVNLSLMLDPASETVTGADISFAGQDPDQWELLLTRERTLVFNEDDPVHITKVAAAIGREHEGLRGATKELGRRYRDWKARTAFGVRRMGPSLPEDCPTVGNVQSLLIGPSAELEPHIDFTEMTTDLELTKLYANAILWHADSDKIAVWNEMSPTLRDLARKAAESRTISAAGLVHVAAETIRACRVAGYDF